MNLYATVRPVLTHRSGTSALSSSTVHGLSIDSPSKVEKLINGDVMIVLGEETTQTFHDNNIHDASFINLMILNNVNISTISF